MPSERLQSFAHSILQTLKPLSTTRVANFRLNVLP
jgi:hypothetical protein